MTRMMLLLGTLSSTQSTLLFAESKNGMVSNIPVWDIVVVRADPSSGYAFVLLFPWLALRDVLLCPFHSEFYSQEISPSVCLRLFSLPLYAFFSPNQFPLRDAGMG